MPSNNIYFVIDQPTDKDSLDFTHYVLLFLLRLLIRF
jgi:hypothetical protein